MFNILSEETDDDTWFLEEYALNPMNAAGDCLAAIAEEISASTFMPIIVSNKLIFILIKCKIKFIFNI